MPSPSRAVLRRPAPRGTAAATAVALASLFTAGPAHAADATLAIYDSAGGAPASGPVRVSALVSRTARKVSFYVDGVKRFTDRTAPWNLTLDTSSLSPGEHTIAARVRGSGWRAGAWKTILVAGSREQTLPETVAGLPELAPPRRPKKPSGKKPRRPRRPARPRVPKPSAPSRPVTPSRPLAPAPAPVVTPAPAPAAALFNGDFETGDHRQWSAVQEAAPDRIQVVPDPVRQGRYASRHEVRAGDSVYGGARAELLWGDDRRLVLKEGSQYVFQWSTYFPADFPSPDPTQGHSTFVQWKDAGTGSPPTGMSTRNERIGLRVANVDQWSIPLTRGVWHDFSVRMRFSSNPSIGFAEVTHNGVPQLFANGQSRFHYATLKPGEDSYLKLGYYRSSSIKPTGILYHDGMGVSPG